jgi:transposase, IS5 family
MVGQPGFFDGDQRLKALSAARDPLKRLATIIDFGAFRNDLEAALSRLDRGNLLLTCTQRGDHHLT